MIVDGTTVGRAEGMIADEVAVGVVHLESEGGEEEEGANFARQKHTTAW